METQNRGSSTAFAEINPTTLSDVPSEQDGIGFAPYVRAIAWFLTAEKTKPPLTVSIEGPWGSGKSSFLLQLENQIRASAPNDQIHHYVRFNAWRSDKDEALWAAFALTFIKQIQASIPIRKRICANVDLLCRRMDWRRGSSHLVIFALSCLAFLGLTILALLHPQLVADPKVSTLGLAIPWLAAIYFGFEHSKKIFGDPLSYDLSRYQRDLKYDEKVAFIERFQQDFSDIIKAYVGEQGRVFIFIDDLDRCEIPRAADLLQAINLLLSADRGNLFFVLALDREMVAAGIAAKNEKILPYLSAGRLKSSSDPKDIYRVGLDYGYSFMEKFVQVPFRVPQPDEREISGWISTLTEMPSPAGSVETPSQRDNKLDIGSGLDPDGFELVVQKISSEFKFNPRRLKQFVNVFRLRLMIALSTGVLVPAPSVSTGAQKAAGITIQQLGLFTAIIMRWPALSRDIAENHRLLTQLSLPRPNATDDLLVLKWLEDPDLSRMVQLDAIYDVSKLDLRPLLLIMPDTHPELRRDRVAEGGRTSLISGIFAQPSESIQLGGNTAGDGSSSVDIPGLPLQNNAAAGLSGNPNLSRAPGLTGARGAIGSTAATGASGFAGSTEPSGGTGGR
jgi:KAP family P-loop domain